MTNLPTTAQPQLHSYTFGFYVSHPDYLNLQYREIVVQAPSIERAWRIGCDTAHESLNRYERYAFADVVNIRRVPQ